MQFHMSIKPRGDEPRTIRKVGPLINTERSAKYHILAIWYTRLSLDMSTESIGLLDSNHKLLAIFDGEWTTYATTDTLPCTDGAQ